MSEPANHQQSTAPAIFIATAGAEKYRQLLADELGAGLVTGTAESSAEVQHRYAGQPVVLGSPDLLVELLQSSPPVHWVQSTWAGVAPLVRLNFRDYQLTGIKDIFGPQMSEYVFGCLLAHEIGLDRRRQAQQERRWDNTESGTLAGRVLGIMGTGSIGRYLAVSARQFGMQVIGFNSRGVALEPFAGIYTKTALKSFLERCDYLVAVLPDTPETDDLLDREALACLKPGAVLVNVGRGNLLDEKALAQALQERRLAAAVLDVFREEPLPPDSPLWGIPNLRITAHIAAVSRPRDIATP